MCVRMCFLVERSKTEGRAVRETEEEREGGGKRKEGRRGRCRNGEREKRKAKMGKEPRDERKENERDGGKKE